MNRRSSPSGCFMLFALLGVVLGVYLVQQNTAPTPESAVPLVMTPLVPTTTGASVSMALAAPATAIPDLPPDSTLLIPSLDVAAPIIQVYLDGWSWDISHLGRRIGHLQGTSLPTSAGNIILSAHVEMSDGQPGIFAPLKNIQLQDEVLLQYGGSLYRYKVTEMYQTTPDDFAPIDATGDRLTLITCGPYDFASNSYPERFVVVAERV
jgi:LPXTG-site transpeptidase (sortase) family protein